MRYTQNLVKNNIKHIKGKEWYHQRFDGCPYLIHIIADNELKNEKRKQIYGGVHTTRVCFFENDRADWYLLIDDIEKTTNKMLDMAKTKQNISSKLLKLWREDEKLFYQKCKEIEKINLSNLSLKELITLHNEYYDIASKRFTSSSIIDGFALGSDEIIAKEIFNFLKNKNLEENYLDIFSKLTAPISQSFINEAEISLLKVAKLCEQNKEIKKNILLGKINESIELIELNSLIQNAFLKHIKKYYWSKNNYVSAHYLDEKHWLIEIKDILLHDLNIDDQIKKILETPRRNKLIKRELSKKLIIPKYIKTLLKISEDLTYWQDERKKATYWNAEISHRLLKQISLKTNYSLDELKYLTVDEVKNLLINPINKTELKNRLNKCVFVWLNNEFECLTKSEVNKIKNIMFKKETNKEIKYLTGLSASLGKVRGRVKVCRSATEVGKVEKNDILVAIMTRPDYIVGMKKASAIITNEGGITCHAAIVSRELGIPCIIGTKIATEVLKDNDLVEVDADKGIVTILN